MKLKVTGYRRSVSWKGYLSLSAAPVVVSSITYDPSTIYSPSSDEEWLGIEVLKRLNMTNVEWVEVKKL